jgi:hypothetical protein
MSRLPLCGIFICFINFNIWRNYMNKSITLSIAILFCIAVFIPASASAGFFDNPCINKDGTAKSTYGVCAPASKGTPLKNQYLYISPNTNEGGDPGAAEAGEASEASEGSSGGNDGGNDCGSGGFGGGGFGGGFGGGGFGGGHGGGGFGGGHGGGGFGGGHR